MKDVTKKTLAGNIILPWLHLPSEYNTLLRTCLISWITSGEPSIDLLYPYTCNRTLDQSNMKNRNPAESKNPYTMGQPVSKKLDGLNEQRKMNHKDVLPDLFDDHFDDGQRNSNAYQVYLRADIHNKETAIKWWEDYNKKTQITMKVAKIFPHSGKINLFKIQLRCQHNTRCKVKDIPKRNDKNTQCPAIITITVKKHIPSSKEDPLIESHPAAIYIYFSHNHPIYCADALRHRPLECNVEKKIHKLFDRGYSPSTALHAYKLELQIQNPQEYENLSGDGSICPNLSKIQVKSSQKHLFKHDKDIYIYMYTAVQY